MKVKTIGMSVEEGPPVEVMVLPRPSKSKYKGSFPLHAEKKILDLVGGVHQNILHPFGGKAEYGIRCDLNPATSPDYIADAHDLPFEDNTFDVTFIDPPYTNKLSKSLYKTGKVNFTKYTKEALRVTKPGGYVIVYHWENTPGIRGAKFILRVLISTRPWHTPREVHIHRKFGHGERLEDYA